MKTEKQLAAEAAQFAREWKGRGYEKGDSQSFWLALLRVLGVEQPELFIRFEEQVKLDNTSFIDGHIDATRVLIEQKSLGKDLRKGIRQSDGSMLTPFQQAKRYSAELPYSQRPRWIVTCNFETFLVYDMERPTGEPAEIHLEDLGKEHYRLRFLVDDGNAHLAREMEVSMQAGELVGRLYDLLLAQYHDPTDPATLRSLNILCVRLVFCLYAEDAGVFGRHDMFHDYLAGFETRHMRKALVDLFEVLNTPPERRDPYLEPELAAFPYTNGGLFAHSDVMIPPLTDEIRHMLLQNASLDFDWSEISPTIFGAVFESTLNPETRRSGGMHYTSIENIHKVIDPLFLDDLRRELDDILNIKVERTRMQQLQYYCKRLGSLTFLDPACGSGNFLTETYLSLRRLENRALMAQIGGVGFLNFDHVIQVNIGQFYGIEINDFAVSVATTALWISEAQTMRETERIVNHDLSFLPLKSYSNIREGNALRIDWNEVIDAHRLNYIMGNPPFVGYSLQSKEQKADILSILVDEHGKPMKTAGKVDFVAAWYFKAAAMMQGTNIRAALVSTNSITQGEQVAALWKPLMERYGVRIDFAHRTFRWDSEATLKAHVHCVIVGFSVDSPSIEGVPQSGGGVCQAETQGSHTPQTTVAEHTPSALRATPPNLGGELQRREHTRQPVIYDGEDRIVAANINGYLVDGPNVAVESRTKPLCDVPLMQAGNRPADGGHLIIEADDYDDFIRQEPKSVNYIKKLTGAVEFINNKQRYCLWLVGVSPADLRSMPLVMERIAACREDRLKGAPDRQKLAETPTLFRETYNPKSYIVVPRVSSENRRYVPMGFLNSETIPTDSATIIPDAGLYHFGVLESNVHMAWMRAVCGRLEMRYRYSKDIVYNNFPWPEVSEQQRQ
ncbi:MAG: class I SAM-dependent DNA methyltransferase, partial [Muribaculaceae bacterium]|nr:class I SAM-dependent DNA methyltransferase [Muribaculaceae bacterium]